MHQSIEMGRTWCSQGAAVAALYDQGTGNVGSVEMLSQKGLRKAGRLDLLGYRFYLRSP